MKNYKEIIKHSFINNTVIENREINEIIIGLINENNLQNYIKKININNNLKYQAIYYPKNKTLEYNPLLISESSYNIASEIGITTDINHINQFYNLNRLITIFHEVEHAIQNKQYEELSDENILRQVIEPGIMMGYKYPNLSLKEKVLYRYHHYIIPTEKAAEINATLKILKLNKELSLFSSNNLNYLYLIKHLTKRLLQGYNINVITNKITSPIESFYNKISKSDTINLEDFNGKYDNMTKLTWGLPIDQVVYDTLKENNDILYSDDANIIANKINSL